MGGVAWHPRATISLDENQVNLVSAAADENASSSAWRGGRDKVGSRGCVSGRQEGWLARTKPASRWAVSMHLLPSRTRGASIVRTTYVAFTRRPGLTKVDRWEPISWDENDATSCNWSIVYGSPLVNLFRSRGFATGDRLEGLVTSVSIRPLGAGLSTE